MTRYVKVDPFEIHLLLISVRLEQREIKDTIRREIKDTIRRLELNPRPYDIESNPCTEGKWILSQILRARNNWQNYIKEEPYEP